MLKGSSSSSEIYDFASKRQPFEVESFNRWISINWRNLTKI
jgi:hypothetical protein